MGTTMYLSNEKSKEIADFIHQQIEEAYRQHKHLILFDIVYKDAQNRTVTLPVQVKLEDEAMYCTVQMAEEDDVDYTPVTTQRPNTTHLFNTKANLSVSLTHQLKAISAPTEMTFDTIKATSATAQLQRLSPESTIRESWEAKYKRHMDKSHTSRTPKTERKIARSKHGLRKLMLTISNVIHEHQADNTLKNEIQEIDETIHQLNKSNNSADKLKAIRIAEALRDFVSEPGNLEKSFLSSDIYNLAQSTEANARAEDPIAHNEDEIVTRIATTPAPEDTRPHEDRGPEEAPPRLH